MKILFAFTTALLLLSCNNSTEVQKYTSETSSPSPKVTYLALGDSYTIGESVEPDMRWPELLADSLRTRGYNIEEPEIIATTGWTTGDLLNAMDRQLGNETYDLVSVSIGVNNQYQGKSITAYEEDLHKIFSRAIDLSGQGREGVFAVSIPDYGVTPFGASNAEEIGREIDEFNNVFRRVAEEYEVDFYNITPISKRAENEPELIAEDGLHPSGRMYGLWVQEFIDKVAQKIPAE